MDIRFFLRMVRGANWRRLHWAVRFAKQQCGRSGLYLLVDIFVCFLRYGAGYYDYVMFGFWDLDARQRDTYVTRVRNKRILQAMNRPEAVDLLDDKRNFARLYASCFTRQTVSLAASGAQEIEAFLDQNPVFFAKTIKGSGGKGVRQIRQEPGADRAALLAGLRREGLILLEARIRQHPALAALSSGVRQHAPGCDGPIRRCGNDHLCAAENRVRDLLLR